MSDNEKLSPVLEPAERLDPALGARLTAHEIRWETTAAERSPIQLGGNLFYHSAPESGTTPHRHDFLEILLITSGRAVHRINGERQLLETRQLSILRPGDVHSLAPAPGVRSCGYIQWDFQLELFLTLSQYLENDAFLHQLTAPVLPPTFLLEAEVAQELENRLLLLTSDPAAPALRKARLKLLLAEVLTRCFLDEDNRLAEAQVPAWLGELCRKMRQPEHYLAGLPRLQSLACRTPEHLCKSFRRHLGKTPTEFINELKLAHAARLLADSDRELLEIIAELNFHSPSYFHRLFRKYYRLSPAEYRRRARRRGL